MYFKKMENTRFPKKHVAEKNSCVTSRHIQINFRRRWYRGGQAHAGILGWLLVGYGSGRKMLNPMKCLFFNDN